MRFILFVPLCDCNKCCTVAKVRSIAQLHKMVDLNLELCLKFVQLKVSLFLQIVFDVLCSIQTIILLSKDVIKWS